MPYRILVILICLFPLLLEAQSLTIKKGDQAKTFGPDTYYEMYFTGESTECCYDRVVGTIERVYKDSIKIRVNELGLIFKSLDFRLNVGGEIKEKDLSLVFSKFDLQELQGYESKKQSKRKQNWATFGGVFLVTGIVTLANSYDFGDKNFRDGVLISGGIQIGLAIISGSIGVKKRYKAIDGWRF